MKNERKKGDGPALTESSRNASDERDEDTAEKRNEGQRVEDERKENLHGPAHVCLIYLLVRPFFFSPTPRAVWDDYGSSSRPLAVNLIRVRD